MALEEKKADWKRQQDDVDRKIATGGGDPAKLEAYRKYRDTIQNWQDWANKDEDTYKSVMKKKIKEKGLNPESFGIDWGG